MHQLVYTSVASPDLDSGDLFEIVQQSARNNPTADITGFLTVHEGCFLQLVEGPLMALEELLDRLGKDRRHHSIRIVDRMPITERSFPNWRMRRLSDGNLAVGELMDALKGNPNGVAVLQMVRAFIDQRKAA